MNSPVARARAALDAAGNPLVPRQMDDLDPRFAAGQPIQERAHVRGSGAAVGQAEFPLVVGLGHDRVHHQAQVFLRRVIDRDHQADDGPVVEVLPRRSASGPGPTRTGSGGPARPGIPR